MNIRASLLSAATAVALGAVAFPAAAVDYYFNATAVSEFGAPTYGHVELSQVGTGVQFQVILDPEFNFVTTGNHYVFAFNGTGVSLADIGTITTPTAIPTPRPRARARIRSSTRRSERSNSVSPARRSAKRAARARAMQTP